MRYSKGKMRLGMLGDGSTKTKTFRGRAIYVVVN